MGLFLKQKHWLIDQKTRKHVSKWVLSPVKVQFCESQKPSELNNDYAFWPVRYSEEIDDKKSLWRPLLPYDHSYNVSCARPGYAVICNFWHPGTLTPNPERQSARMSKNDKWRLNPVWHRMLYSCIHTPTVGDKGIKNPQNGKNSTAQILNFDLLNLLCTNHR